ncbi:carbon monoxide dehydrogenase [Streptomyces sp. PRKS01-65]|nr:SRPBCC domain-containing protein [Streptomyces harenosi]NEY34662.1 carbon monoxide dehydrogenase [Streptomyces harenosi]
MEHEVFVPVPAERLREVLADPGRVAGAVPGLQQDTGAGPVAGRLRVRIGGHTITYRGAGHLSRRDDGTYAVEGEATEARGTGAVRLALTLRVTDAEDGRDGSVLAFTGSATADGRVTDLPAEAVASAATRLLNRFAENLGHAARPHPKTAESLATEDFEPSAAGDFDAAPDADDAPLPPVSPAEPAAGAPPGTGSVSGTEVPPSSLDPTTDAEGVDADLGEDLDENAGEGAGEGFPDAAEPPAEAAHARRTMIGRSAEEVDHAPPRGRYAPVPAPQTVTVSTSLRWAAPAAALVVASAIVVGRVLRRRR